MATAAKTSQDIKPVEIFANDWNGTIYRHQLMIFPSYSGSHLLEVRINLNSERFNTDDYQWHELLAKGEKALPVYASIEHDRTDFSRGMINLRVNCATTGYREETIAEWLAWLTADFLPTIKRH